jgi:hypothetical protein
MGRCHKNDRDKLSVYGARPWPGPASLTEDGHECLSPTKNVIGKREIRQFIEILATACAGVQTT